MSASTEAPQNSPFVWIPEPDVQDDTYATRGEDKVSWLRRSTVTRARAAREFLNFNLSRVPERWRPRLCHELETRWDNAFFELIVARTAQVLGADIEVEEETPSGTRPDFIARFPTGNVVIEATTPVINPEIDTERRAYDELLAIIEEFVPSGWTAITNQLPVLGPSDSKKPFRRAIKRLFDRPLPDTGEAVPLQTSLDYEPIEMSLLRLGPDLPRVDAGPAVAYWGDARSTVRKAIRRKRRQVRSAPFPVLLAVNGSWRATTWSLDQVVFGMTVQHQDGHVTFEPTGEFSPEGSREPTYAGLLFFEDANFGCSAEPTLYIHPRATPLPHEFNIIERRELTAGRDIAVRPAAETRLLKRLRPVDLHSLNEE